jgi:hypothetical protein
MQRFNKQIESCQGDAKRLRQCLVNGYKQNGARWIADGTYRSIRGNTVSTPSNFLELPDRGTVGVTCSPEFYSLYKKAVFRLGYLPRNRGDQEDTVSLQASGWLHSSITLAIRMSIITEVEPEW